MSRLQKRLLNRLGRASRDFKLIEPNDKIMVCLSGGKDSYAMLDILLNLQKSANRLERETERPLSIPRVGAFSFDKVVELEPLPEEENVL